MILAALYAGIAASNTVSSFQGRYSVTLISFRCFINSLNAKVAII